MSKYDHFLTKKVSFLGQWIAQKVTSDLFGIVCKYIPVGKKIIEIGPGAGELAKLLIKQGHTYYCYDRNENIINNLLSFGIDARLSEVPPLPVADSSADCVVIINVLEHMNDIEMALNLLADVRRVLGSGGKIIAMAPNYSGWGSDFYEVDYTHSLIISTERIRNMFHDVGFEIVLIKNVYGCFNGFIGLVLDTLTNFIFSILHQIFPMNTKMIKGKSLFHPNLLVVAEVKKS